MTSTDACVEINFSNREVRIGGEGDGEGTSLGKFPPPEGDYTEDQAAGFPKHRAQATTWLKGPGRAAPS